MSFEVTELFEQSVQNLFSEAVRVVAQAPLLAAHLLRTKRWQQQAAKLRAEWAKKGLNVPPFMIMSVTNRCNLHCAGCYHRAQHRPEQELATARLRSILQEASDLGIAIALLAGGEPLMRADLLQVTKEFPRMLFPVFTNGLLLPDYLAVLQQQRNVIPIVSLEGQQMTTDARRGSGVYQQLSTALAELREKNIIFGASLTVTRNNYGDITSPGFVQQLVELGTKVLFYVEYVPVDESSNLQTLLPEQQRAIPQLMETLRQQFNALFIAFPGDEEAFGGCLAAGRGFIHISATGDVEPCPFAPYSDSNLGEVTLTQALQSPLLRQIREQHGALTEVRGGCALWEKRDWLRSLQDSLRGN